MQSLENFCQDMSRHCGVKWLEKDIVLPICLGAAADRFYGHSLLGYGNSFSPLGRRGARSAWCVGLFSILSKITWCQRSVFLVLGSFQMSRSLCRPSGKTMACKKQAPLYL